MEAACISPKKEKRERERQERRHIPAEIVEEILLYLPARNLARLSCVSKSWNSMIFDLGFIKRHHGHATLPGGENIIINPRWPHIKYVLSCPLSSLSSENPIEDARVIISPIPIRGDPTSTFLGAWCDELWCVNFGKSLYLLNPSMATYRELPECSLDAYYLPYAFFYGLGYDPVGDDYKLLRIPWNLHDEMKRETINHLYSLKSNSWRKIRPFSRDHGFALCHASAASVNGALHWIGTRPGPSVTLVVVPFNLSTEKYNSVMAAPDATSDNMMLSVLKGTLCLCMRSGSAEMRYVLWLMADYGNENSWMKMIEIDVIQILEPYCLPSEIQGYGLSPFYLYDNGDILIRVSSFYHTFMIFKYNKENAIFENIVRLNEKFCDVYVHLEALISPASWSNGATNN